MKFDLCLFLVSDFLGSEFPVYAFVHDGLSYFSLSICCGIFLGPGDLFLFILYQAMKFRRLNSDRFPLVQISLRREFSQTYRLCNWLGGEVSN